MALVQGNAVGFSMLTFYSETEVDLPVEPKSR